MKRRSLLALGPACLVVGTLPAAVRAADEVPLSVAVGHSEPAAEVYYAQEMGFFDRAGIRVQITTLANGAATSAGLISGAIHIASTDILVVARAQQRGVPFVIVAPSAMYDTNKPTSLFVVAPAGPIRTPKDLEGKVVAGISLGGLEHLGQLAWFEQNHVDASTIKFLELPTSEMVQALDQGRVAGATMGEPFLSAQRSQIRVLGKDLDAIAPRFLETAFVADADWAKAHADAVQRFATAIGQAGAWANGHPEQAAAIMAKDMRIDVTRPHVTYANAAGPELIQPLLDAAFHYGLLDRRFAASALVWRP